MSSVRSDSTNNNLLPPISMPGDELEVIIEDGYEETMVFDDTVVMDSPSLEVQMENFGGDTEDLDIDKEVALDSDDEAIQRNVLVSLVSVLPRDKIDRTLGGEDGVLVEERQLSPAAKQAYVGYFRRQGSKIRSYSSSANSIYLKQHNISDSEADGIQYQIKAHGSVRDGAEEKMNWESNANLSEFVDGTKNSDMVRNISTGDEHAEEVPSSSCEAVDGGKEISFMTSDHKFASLSYIESQEPGEPSQANALDFVEHYLSVIDVNFSPEVERRKVARITSPPSLCGKGSQTLARRANSRSGDGESKCFDWSSETSDMTDVFFVKRKRVVSDCKSHGQRSISISQGYGNPNFKIEEEFVVQGKVQLQSRSTNESDKELTPKTLSRKRIPEIAQTNVMKINTDSTMELDEQLGKISFGQQLENDDIERDVPNMFDIGFNTQMAAEVMETLIHMPPPDSNTCPQVLENSLEEFPESEMMSKDSKCNSLHDRPGSEVIDNRSRNRVGSSKFEENKSNSDQECSVQRKVSRGMPLTGKENMKDVDRNHISVNSVNCDSQAKGKEKGNLKISPPIALGTRRSSANLSVNNIEGPRCNSVERLDTVKDDNTLKRRKRRQLDSDEKNIKVPRRKSVERLDTVKDDNVLKRRKRRQLDSDVYQVLDVRQKYPKLGSNTHCETTKSNVNVKSNTDPFVAAVTSHIKLDFWTFPKRKRTCQKVPHNRIEPSDSCPLSELVCSKNCNTFSAEFCQKSSENSTATHLIFHVNRKARSPRQRKSSAKKKIIESIYKPSFGEANLGDVNCNSPLTDGKMSCNQNDLKASCQSGKLDDVDILSSADGAGEKFKFDELPNAKRTLLIYPGTGNCKQFLKKSSLRSPLMRELSRLGFSESLPEFSPIDLRRRRNMANIQVLFSQSLDDDIIKQQRKILARLGISVASSCSEATHFITDRFVRTKNMLEAIAFGKPVVTHLWLKNCAQASCVVDEKNYILRDTEKEKEIGFNMSVSLAHARQHPLLKGQRVFITSNVEPSKEIIKSLVKAVHGQI